MQKAFCRVQFSCVLQLCILGIPFTAETVIAFAHVRAGELYICNLYATMGESSGIAPNAN